MASSPQSTLLGAARAWMQRSKSTAVLAIAPLAIVAVAPAAKGQVTFGPAGSPNVGGDGGTDITVELGPVFNSAGVTGGITFGSNITVQIEKDSPTFDFSITYSGSASGFLPAGLLAISWVYSLGPPGGLSVGGTDEVTLFGPDGVSLGTQTFSDNTHTRSETIFTGSGNYSLATGSNITGYSFEMLGIVNTGSGSDSLLTMNQGSGQGITFAPAVVPEPATTAGIAGLFALVCAFWRRRASRLARAG